MAATTTVTERIVDAFARTDHAALVEHYAPDAVLDANVPYWRYQIQGAGAISEAIAEEFDVPDRRTTYFRETVRDDLVMIEWEFRAPMEGEERLVRDVHLLFLADGRICEHVVYCTGFWTAEQIARQAREAPMVAS